VRDHDVLIPFLDRGERLQVCQIKHDDGNVSSSIVTTGDALESFLSCSIPYLMLWEESQRHLEKIRNIKRRKTGISKRMTFRIEHPSLRLDAS
jgi:hypothetical protein